MAKFKSFKELKVTGVSDAKAIRLAIKQFEDSAKKRSIYTAKSLGKVLETIPLKYMKLLVEEKDYLISIINLEILNANTELDESNNEKDALSNIKYLEEIRNIFNTNKQITKNELLSAKQKMSLLEVNWKYSGKLNKKQALIIKKARLVLNKITNLEHQGTTIKELPELIALSEIDMSLSTKLIKETYVSSQGGKGKISIELEPTAINNYKGKLSNLVVGMVERELSNTYKTKEMLDSFDIQHVGFSPSFVEDIELFLTTAILGKKNRNIKRKNVSKTEAKQARSAKLRAAKSKVKSKVLPKLPTIKQIEAGADLPLFSIMALINEALDEQIKDNMGDSNDPPILLRNQTGRFAESAKMLSLTRSKAGALMGTYTYMRNPYDVFLPGHKLGTTERNPRIYIEGSIRELAIAIMKRKFPGLSLELV